MNITSYAQNFEDVMLWRALSHIERGTYIDVGAQDPTIDSVSLAFHERGWRGFHVEPTPHYAELLRQQRPGDTVIQAAVGNGPAVLRFFEIPGTGISTADVSIAAQHRERGFDVHEITVPCVTLSALFEASAGAEIHWLKIDVEGFEEQVLSSWGSSAARPWIVVVESTLPLTQIETHEKWETILIAYGYTPVYFDGLNRYYVSEAHPEINGAFLTPPNVFDGFALNGTASAPFHRLLEARYLDRINETLAQIELQKTSANSEIEGLNLTIASLGKTHVEREQVLTQQLQAVQRELGNLLQERATREQALSEQSSQAQQRLEGLLLTLAQREQRIGEQILAIQQQAAQEASELARRHSEQERVLQRQHAEREQVLAQQLQAGQDELRNLQHDRAKREQILSEQVSQARQQTEGLLRTLARREQEVATQLLAIQQQFAQEMLEMARGHSEQERSVRRQQDERERLLTEQLNCKQQELRNLEQGRVKREQEVGAQLATIRQQAAWEIAELAERHTEQVHALQRQYAEHVQALTQLQQAAQEEHRKQEQGWAQREEAFDKEIAALRDEALVLHQAQQVKARQHDAELTSQLDERNRIVEACAALEVQLKAELLLEQQTNLRLRQALAHVQEGLAATRASFTWRMTAPLRTLASFIVPRARPTSESPAVVNASDTVVTVISPSQSVGAHRTSAEAVMSATTDAARSHTPADALGETVLVQAATPFVSESQTINIRYASIESIMLPSSRATTPILASTLDELLAHHDQQFVHCAYQTLLGRAPDPEGLVYYLGRLRAGISKVRLLKQMWLSPEGKAHAASLPGLEAAIRHHQKEQLPVIGWLFRLHNGTEGNHSTGRKLRGIENQLFLLSEESHRRFNQMEAALASLQHLVVQQTQTMAATLGGAHTATPDASNISLVPPAEPEGLKKLSPHAKTIYYRLKSAAAKHTESAA